MATPAAYSWGICVNFEMRVAKEVEQGFGREWKHAKQATRGR
jgi:hypothetical protein